MMTCAKNPRRPRTRHAWWYWPLRARVAKLHRHKAAWRRGRWLERMRARILAEMGGPSP